MLEFFFFFLVRGVGLELVWRFSPTWNEVDETFGKGGREGSTFLLFSFSFLPLFQYACAFDDSLSISLSKGGLGIGVGEV